MHITSYISYDVGVSTVFAESEIKEPYNWAESFSGKNFTRPDEYDDLYFKYLALLSDLEATLNDRELKTLKELVRVQSAMERYCRFHYFQEGVHYRQTEEEPEVDHTEDF